MGKTIAVLGIIILVFGLLIMLLERLGMHRGLLPGDIYIRRGNWTLYFPIVTSIVLSILLTLILFAVSYFSRR
ncbi:MAG: DUF2905 domain-containing protein [Armatimonadota bacterium]|nr:DUF2905 domain-containing protein [Armatimonadota bacterium]